jgi:hypothetical protein
MSRLLTWAKNGRNTEISIRENQFHGQCLEISTTERAEHRLGTSLADLKRSKVYVAVRPFMDRQRRQEEARAELRREARRVTFREYAGQYVARASTTAAQGQKKVGSVPW